MKHKVETNLSKINNPFFINFFMFCSQIKCFVKIDTITYLILFK